MELPTELIEGLNVALNEATLLGVEVVAEQRVATITLSVLSMPDEGPPSSEVRVELVFSLSVGSPPLYDTADGTTQPRRSSRLGSMGYPLS